MKNPIYQIIKKKKAFTYFHTHAIDRTVLDAAVATKKSLELDVSITPSGSVYIGHPLAMYKFHHLPAPRNLPLETILKEAKAANLFLMFDCKDVRVLPRVQKAIQEYGTENCALHSCVQELEFTPYSKKIIVEPHWNDEQLPVGPVLAIKQSTNVPLVLCCRGISQELIDAQGEKAVTEKILRVAEGNAEVVVLNMPKDELPPLSIMQTLLEHNILCLFNVNRTPPSQRPPVFLGSTDILEYASDPRDFQ